VVRFGDPKNYTFCVETILVGDLVCASADEATSGRLSASGELVPKAHPTSADALALAREELWAQEEQTFYGSPWEADTVKVPRAYVERLTEAVCYAA